MRWLQQMHQFVNHNVFQAFRWLLRQIRVQPNAARIGTADAPFGLHSLNKEPGDLHANDGFFRLLYKAQSAGLFFSGSGVSSA